MGARLRNSTECWDLGLTAVATNVCPYALPLARDH
jgi:hypothetical protein